MTEFKKLDEYLKEYLESSNYDIVSALSKALKIDVNHSKRLYDNLDHDQELRLVVILDDSSLSKEDKSLQIRKIFDDEDLWEDDTFNGLDLSEDYNYRCSLGEINCREKYMDWLEENQYNYLINTDGKFAIKCPTRESMYKARRMSDECRNKYWLKPDYGMNIDPVKRHPSLSMVSNKPTLRDHIGVDHDTMGSFKGSVYRASPFTKDTTPNHPYPLGKEKDLNDVEEGHKKDKRKAEQRKQQALMVGKPNPAKELGDSKYRQRIKKSKKGFDKKKERQTRMKDLDEGMIAFDGIPSFGRIGILAGLSTNEDEIINDNEEVMEYAEADLSVIETQGFIDSLRDIIYRLDNWLQRSPEQLGILEIGIEYFENILKKAKKGEL